MLIDDGRLERVDGRWVAVGDLDNMPDPPGIHALLAARLELLGNDERALLGRAAVMGQTFYVGASRSCRHRSWHPDALDAARTRAEGAHSAQALRVPQTRKRSNSVTF